MKEKTKTTTIKGNYLETLPYAIQRDFRGILRHMLPYLNKDEHDVLIAEILIALKLEGIIGARVSATESKMVNFIKESILQNKNRKEEALDLFKKLK